MNAVLPASHAGDRGVDEIRDGVIGPPLQQIFQHGRSPFDACREQRFPELRRIFAAGQSLMADTAWRNAEWKSH
jgi:hypothetical protein